MSSDYIPRLRDELVRAAERRQPRWRRALPPLRPLVAVAAVALVVLAVAVVAGRGGSAADEFEYSVAGGAAEQAAAVMRERLDAAGVGEATVSVGSDGRLVIDAPDGARAAVAALTQPGELAFYDWETSVLGPDGRPAPRDATVTGGDDAGAGAGTTRSQAELRVAAAGGGQVVRTLEGAPERWYALGGEPAITNADIAGAEPIVDLFTDEPAVGLEFTERGQDEFTELTRAVTRRGADERSLQHFAIVIDDRIVSMPFVDHRDNPDGIDGIDGAQVSGGMTTRTADWIAAMLDSGPLPAELLPAGG
jgi:preprotein translocase subunit SecD